MANKSHKRYYEMGNMFFFYSIWTSAQNEPT